MADSAATPPQVELDDEGKKLQIAAEKAKLRQDIAEAGKAEADAEMASLASMTKGLPEGPKGQTTLAEKAVPSVRGRRISS